MIEDEQETELVSTSSAAEYLADVLKEMQSLAESAIRLAAQQSDWKSVQIAMAARENAQRLHLWLAAPDEQEEA